MAIHFSLKTKMSTAVFLLVSAILLTGGFSLLTYFEFKLKESISDQQFTLVSRIAEDIDVNIAQTQGIIIRVAAGMSTALLEKPDLAQAHLDERFESISHVFDNGIFLFSATGNLIAESPFLPDRRGKDFAFREYFRKTVETRQPYISSPYFSSKAHNHPVISFTAPIRDNSGNMVGVLAGVLDLTQDNMLGRIARTRIGKNGYLYLYSTDRTMIMHPDPTRILKQDVPPGANRLFDRAIGGFEGSGETVNSRGLHALSSFKRLSTVDWILAANYPVQEAFAPIRIARHYFAFGMAIAVLLTIMVVWLTMRRFIEPLLIFTHHVESVTASQSYQEPLQVGTQDEIATLADSFNRLMAEVETQKQIAREQGELSVNLLQNSAVPCFVIDIDHKVLTWTRACEELTGVAAVEVVGSDRHWQAFYPEKRPCLVDLVVTGDLEKTFDLYPSCAKSPFISEGMRTEGWFPAVGGKPRYLRVEAAPIRDSSGALIAAIETLHDLTGLKQIEQALRESEQSSRSLIELSPDAIVVHCDGKIVFVNQAAARLFAARAPKDMAGIEFAELLHPDNRGLEQRRVARGALFQEDTPYAEDKILRLDGAEVDVEAGSTPVYYSGRWAVQTVLRDIRNRKKLQEQIWRQANYDILTGIPNRMMFFDRLQLALAHAEREKQRFALLFIDLDHFKEVNDTLGHAAGDTLLQEVAQRLDQCLRKTATLARMGGDEFTVILPGVGESAVVKLIVERMLQRLAEPFYLPEGEVNIYCSIGIAFYSKDAKDAAILMKHADMAMYQAKENGRNGYCFYRSEQISHDGASAQPEVLAS